jgi:hypothetical protein
MKLKLSALFDSIQPLGELVGMELPASGALLLSRTAKKVQTEIDTANETRKKLVDKYTQKNEDGNVQHPVDKDGKPIEDQVVITDPALFNKELTELFSTEIDLDVSAIDIKNLGDVHVKPATLIALDWLFK